VRVGPLNALPRRTVLFRENDTEGAFPRRRGAMPAGAVLKKSWGHRFRDGPNPVTSVELVEALPAETAAR
jgi:hypothetical protein